MMLSTANRALLSRASIYCSKSCVACSFSSSSQSFFGYNSGRARRRRRRQALMRRRKDQSNKEGKMESGNDEGVVEDTRTVMDILWPNPFKDEEPIDKFKWPTSPAVWRRAFKMAWKEYTASWEGYFTSRGFVVEDKEDLEKRQKEQQDAINEKREIIQDNIRNNTQFLKEESEKLRTELRDRTGIHSKEDLRKFAADMMRLATNCVNEFMSGYRKGRDDEVEKMLTQYFQELEEEANKPRRRKPKRRVRNRFHPGATRLY